MLVNIADITENQPITADICIIGAGAAGISMALELIGSGLDVVVLESGGLGEESETQALYSGTVSDEQLHSPPDKYRQRRFGGTTTIWGGRCMPFDDIDFEVRDYIPDSGWPFDRGQILPFYAQANQICEAGPFAYTVDKAFSSTTRPMIAGFNSNLFSTDRLERFSCPTNFGIRYQHKLRAANNIRVMLHANVTHLQLNEAGSAVVAATIASLKGKQGVVHAKQFVIATGGIEVVRLLLASNNIQKNGIGNDRDIVGRYYMCHLAGTIGAIKFNLPLSSVWHGYDISDEGVYCRRRFALSESVQREQRIGNFIARLHHPRITDPAHHNAILSLLYLAKFLIPYEYGKRLHGEERSSVSTWMQHIRNVVTGPFDTLGFAWHMFRDRKLAERKFPSIIIKSKANLFSLDFHAEQQPNPASRITLNSDRDVLGMPRLNIDWRYTSGDLDTVSRGIALLAGEIRNSGLATFDYDPNSVELEMTRYGAYGGHHIGTTRMGTNVATSVVNQHCQVHGVDNLHIASAAVFPTSSQANPTLTIVAFALRLAQHLKRITR